MKVRRVKKGQREKGTSEGVCMITGNTLRIFSS